MRIGNLTNCTFQFMQISLLMCYVHLVLHTCTFAMSVSILALLQIDYVRSTAVDREHSYDTRKVKVQ